MSSRPYESRAQMFVIHPRSGVAVIEFRGDHDLTTKADAMSLMDNTLALVDLLVLDLSRADFIDSSFLYCLFLIDKHAKGTGKHVRLQLGTAAIVEKALKLSGILEIVDRVHTREEALE